MAEDMANYRLVVTVAFTRTLLPDLVGQSILQH
jgi:hypothetical protein